jgi:hypothetical protein
LIQHRPKVKYEVPAAFADVSKQLIIDMRGPEQRVLSSLTDAEKSTAIKEVRVVGDLIHMWLVPMLSLSFDTQDPKSKCPELMYNIRMLVDKSLIEVQNLDRKIAWERDQCAVLAREQEQLKQIAREEEQRMHIQCCSASALACRSKGAISDS